MGYFTTSDNLKLFYEELANETDQFINQVESTGKYYAPVGDFK